MKLLAALALACVASGCGHRMLASHGREHGNLFAHAEDSDVRQRDTGDETPLVVLVEKERVVAVDPIAAKTRWSIPLRVTGHPVASGDAIYLPARGHRIVAVERKSGRELYTIWLPGEALTGLAVADPWLVATVVDDKPGVRARVLGYDTNEGEPRWDRPSATPVGIPEVVGRVAVMPVGDQVVALRARSGRELARLDLSAARAQGIALERVTHRRGAWFAGGGTRWVGLGAAGEGSDGRELVAGYSDLLPAARAMDVGHGDDERLQLWLRFNDRDPTPRDAILLARRVVVAMRLDTEGLPVRARWVYEEPGRELVAMEVTGDRVVLVREDGGIVTLSDDDGHVLDRIAGDEPVRGALIMGAPANGRGTHGRDDDPDAIADLRRLLVTDDPRILPAQQLASLLLWRNDDVRVRRLVSKLADGELRDDASESTALLRAHAATLVAGRWGSGSTADVDALVHELERRPGFGRHAADDLAPSIRAAVRSGRPEVVDELGALLLHPGTRSEDLLEIVAALDQLDDARAVPALDEFVRRYHADEVIANESMALFAAADLLLEHAAEGGNAGEAIVRTLRTVAEDPLCEPRLRASIVAGLAKKP
ncbi:MAG TPA: PQQ-binding-like beta-propeller repeat protein [Nannocystaceae bacterium]|nr:PQQ-binding-like beta-propeller repeat protein [Nannocystaceae bacterium]